MNSQQLIDNCPGVTYRKLDYWCHKGIFGPALAEPGTGGRRQFTQRDCRIARVLGRISVAFDDWAGGPTGRIPIYQEVAEQLNQGRGTAIVVLGPGLSIVVEPMAMS